MRTSLQLITAPTHDPVDVTEVKTWARIDGSTEDSIIEDMIKAATQEAERFLRSAIINQTWEMTLDLVPSALDNNLRDGVYQLPISELYGSLPRVIKLAYAPISSITSVKYYDLTDTEATYSASNYSLDTAGNRLVLDYGATWPSNLRREAAIRIRYVAGYGSTGASVPSAIKIAIMAYAAAMYESRGICEATGDPLAEFHARLQPYRNMTL
jgi:hypothetical protein